MQNTKFTQAVNTLAKAKLIKTKHKNLFKLIVAFNVTQTNANNNYIFPAQKQCAFVSGDLCISDIQNALAKAQQQLNTNNILLVN